LRRKKGSEKVSTKVMEKKMAQMAIWEEAANLEEEDAKQQQQWEQQDQGNGTMRGKAGCWNMFNS
jgi:hypothetical protein